MFTCAIAHAHLLRFSKQTAQFLHIVDLTLGDYLVISIRRNTMLKMISSAALLTLLVQFYASMPAQAGENEQKRKPPKEAIQACVDKVEGEEVTFKGRRGEDLNATCVYMHGELVALPKGHKRRDD